MITECFVAGSTECLVAVGVESFVTECFVAGGTVSFVAWGTDYFVGTFLVVLSAYCHPNLPCVPPHSCKWDNVVPMSTFLQPA